MTFTGEKGGIVYEQNFDAWGNYRNITDWSYVKKNHIPQWLNRGYTGHEHLIRFGPHTPNWVANSPDNTLFMPFNIINMNGRIYDPMIGRMMSPDNYTHDDAGTQGYNRYSYANNNPLKFTDPDGNFWHIVAGAAIGGVINAAAHWNNKGNFDNIWTARAAAFGIGAGAGALVAIAGPAILPSVTAFGGAGISAAVGNGIINGALQGAVGAAYVSVLQGTANSFAFNDAYSVEQLGKDILFGAAGGAVIGGIGAGLKYRPNDASSGETAKRIDPTPSPNIAESNPDFVGPPSGKSIEYWAGGDYDVPFGSASGSDYFDPITGFQADKGLATGRAEIKQWLQSVENLDRGQLINDIESVGFKNVFDGKGIMNFKRGGMTIRLDPPQGKTLYNHMHLEYGGNSYNKLLNPVNYKIPAAHIPIR